MDLNVFRFSVQMHTFTNNNMNIVDSCKGHLVFPLQKRGEKVVLKPFVFCKRPFFFLTV